MGIKLNVGDYNDAVKKIKKANERTKDNNDNFDITFNKCAASSLTKYEEAIRSMKSMLLEYYNCMLGDIGDLDTIRENYQNLDKSSKVK